MPTLEVGLLVLGFGVRGCRVWGILGLGFRVWGILG